MPFTLDTLDFKDIRELVSEDLDDTILSDADIQRDIRLGVAKDEVFGRAGITEEQWDSLDSKTQFKLKIAVKYQTAIVILPTVDQLLQESLMGRSTRIEEKSWKDKISIYAGVVDENIVPSGGGGSSSGYLTAIGVIRAKR